MLYPSPERFFCPTAECTIVCDPKDGEGQVFVCRQGLAVLLHFQPYCRFEDRSGACPDGEIAAEVSPPISFADFCSHLIPISGPFSFVCLSHRVYDYYASV